MVSANADPAANKTTTNSINNIFFMLHTSNKKLMLSQGTYLQFRK
jgi:hypothetical protein